VTPLVQAPARWQALLFGTIVLIACVGAFVGLSTSSLWIDELFTIHLIHHDGGLSEVFRRALTDDQPPLYYFFLYGWSRIAGLSEWALRVPSAVFAVFAIGIFAAGTRRVLSPPAIAFACAVAVVSNFWFNQAQYARSYTLCMALAAALLSAAVSLRRRSHEQGRFPLASWIWLSLLGLVASLTHAYLLLALGMIFFFLLLTVASWRTRIALVFAGVFVVACNVAYYRVMMHATQLDVHNLWFGNTFGFFSQQTRLAILALIAPLLMVVVAALLVLALRRVYTGQPFFVRDEADTRWSTALAGFVLMGVLACGIAVSLLVAPSLSDRNLLTCAPFAWLLFGRLYDAVGPRGYTRRSAAMAVLVALVVGSYLLLLRGRELPRNEVWRQSSHYVQQLPGCANQPLPVILPYRFGHDTTYFRNLAAQDLFGYYLTDPTQVQAYLPSEFGGRHPAPALSPLLASRADNATGGGCTLLAWGDHDMDEASAIKVALDLARQHAVMPRRVLVQEFKIYRAHRLGWEETPSGYVFLAIPPASPSLPVQAPPLPDVHVDKNDASAFGNRVVVEYLDTRPEPYLVDVYSVQRWNAHGVHEDFIAAHRLTCDPPLTAATADVWPDPSSPGCTERPLPMSKGKLGGGL
jgi:hypothetical protein